MVVFGVLLIIELSNTVIEVLIIENLLIIELSTMIIEVLIIDVGLLIIVNCWSASNVIRILGSDSQKDTISFILKLL